MTKPLDLTFTAPTVPLSINRVTHWAQRERRVKPWKEAAWATAHNARVRLSRAAYGGQGWVPGPVTIQVVLPFRGNQRRDAHNYTGTVVKAVVDGIVRAGLVPDDTPDWVTVLDSEMVVVRDRAQPLTVTVRIRPRETP